MNILVTGALGQLGSELRRLAGQHPSHTFFFTDVAELDITNAERVNQFVSQHAIALTINCAAFTAVDKAEQAAELCEAINHDGPRVLAQAMNEYHGAMIHVSTDYVFDGTASTPYTEDIPTRPIGVYGRTKLRGEEAVRSCCPTSVVVRTAWLYSSFGNNFVKTMLRLGRERSELGVVFDQIGSPTYARDLAVALLTIVEKGIVPGIYHFTNEGVCSWYDFTRAIHQLAGITSCQVRPIHTADYPTPAERPHFSVLDKSKFKATYDTTIPWWEESLRNCLQELGELQAR